MAESASPKLPLMPASPDVDKETVKTRLWSCGDVPARHDTGTVGPGRSPSGLLAHAPLALLAAALLLVGGAVLDPLVPALAVVAVGLAAASALAARRRMVAFLEQVDAASTSATAGAAGVLVPPAAGHVGPALSSDIALTEEVERSRRCLASIAVIDASPDLTVILGTDGLIRLASPAAAPMLGRPAAWLTGRQLAGLVHADDRPRLDLLLRRLADKAPATRASEELRLSHLQGHWVHTEVGGQDLSANPDVSGVVLNVRDVTDRKAHEDDLVRRALHDPLTGLANRTLFREHVEQALGRLRRTPTLPHAVLFVDLDGFKTVNDSLGHAAGDEVLVEVGARLRRWVRPGDTAARLGGDEFAVLLENTSELDTGTLAQRILQVLLTPILVQGKEVVLTGSIGIALSETGHDADELLRNADAAMYTAKAAGKGQYRLFEPEMHEAALRRLDLEADLRRALENDELFLTYQPIFDLATTTITGMEVLVRWQHPERGLIQPLDFISVAEESGLIRPMGRFILDKACHQVSDWQKRFPFPAPLRVCVNASVRQIEHPAFYDEVAEALATTGLDGQSLTLEITESLFMNDFQATVANLCRLKELGLKLAVDDFGTGYSSLSYLRSLPIDILKIDRSFVSGVTRGVEQSAVARAIVKLSRTFNLQTVAEGIEEPEQAAELLAIGADMGQGYWFSRPLDADAMEKFLAERLPGSADRALVPAGAVGWAPPVEPG